MNGAQKIVRALGFGALALFLIMAVILQFWIAPEVGFLPQAEFQPYTDIALQELAQDLRDSGWDRVYRALLLGVDFIFIVMFGLWIMLVHMSRSSIYWRFWGVTIGALFMAFDFSENMMLAVRMGFASRGTFDAGALSADVSEVHYVTLAKYGIVALCLLSAFVATRKRG